MIDASPASAAVADEPAAPEARADTGGPARSPPSRAGAAGAGRA